MTLAWGVKPPAAVPYPEVRIFSLKPDQAALGRILERPVGIIVHWIDGRSQPCRGPRCAQCGIIPGRWKGYAPCEIWGIDPKGVRKGWHRWILEVTENMSGQLERFELGEMFEMLRPGRRSNGPVLCRTTTQKAEKQPGEAWDIRPHLLRLWGLLDDPTAGISVVCNPDDLLPLPSVSARAKGGVA